MRKLTLLAFAAIGLTSCWTSIHTVAPTTEYVPPVQTVYSTTVTTPTPKHTTVTTVEVTHYNADMSFYLDLNAVAAAFAESRSVQEFEQLLNSSRYMINNLDLNRDGWVDYLRVIETHRGYYHTLLIQACLAPGVFQDVATLIAERRSDVLYVEVVGDRYLYGYNYIVRPVFVKRPPLWDVYGRASYSAWNSPYYYGYFPTYYTRPKPIYLNHYQAYVNTYMSNHHYCHHCDYPTVVFYTNYTVMTQPHSRNDYATQHPNDSFEQRVTHNLTSNGSGVTVRNAGQLRTEVNRQNASTRENTSTRESSTTTTTTVNRQSNTTSNSTSTSGTNTRTSTATNTKTSTTSSTTARKPESTTTKTTATRQPSSTTLTRQPSTTVETRVNKSGTTRTTVKTTDASGRTQTVKRESSTTRQSSGSTRTSSSTSGSSSRSSQGTKTESNPRSGQRAR